MKYFVGFFRFWRHFILGDDSTIAFSVMWILLFTWSLGNSFFNAWFMVPVATTVLLVALVYVNAAPRRAKIDFGIIQKVWIVIVLPMVAITAAPNFAFRFINGYVDSEHLLLPLAIYIFVAIIFGLIVSWLYKFIPGTCVFAAGALSYVQLLLYQPEVVRLTMLLDEKYTVASSVLALIICLGFIVQTIVLLRPKKAN